MEESAESSLRDPLFGKAALLVLAFQHGSTSLLQRLLEIGYIRAGKIMDELEVAGIVGPFEGSQGRGILFEDPQSIIEFLLGRSARQKRKSKHFVAERLGKSIFPDSNRK